MAVMQKTGLYFSMKALVYTKRTPFICNQLLYY